MGNHVPETGQIDLMWRKQLANDRLDPKDDLHQMISRHRIEVGHFLNVRVPDHPAKTRVMRVIDPYDATGIRLPEDSPSSLAA
jgi:hypothetical protein